ncbi:MAG: hypothetical protein AAFU64_03300, partial [Bacteroidota bacterium]
MLINHATSGDPALVQLVQSSGPRKQHSLIQKKAFQRKSELEADPSNPFTLAIQRVQEREQVNPFLRAQSQIQRKEAENPFELTQAHIQKKESQNPFALTQAKMEEKEEENPFLLTQLRMDERSLDFNLPDDLFGFPELMKEPEKEGESSDNLENNPIQTQLILDKNSQFNSIKRNVGIQKKSDTSSENGDSDPSGLSSDLIREAEVELGEDLSDVQIRENKQASEIG